MSCQIFMCFVCFYHVAYHALATAHNIFGVPMSLVSIYEQLYNYNYTLYYCSLKG